MRKIVVNFCPTGMVPTKTTTPVVPISPHEIIEQTHEVYELGITVAHFHAREDDGAPTYQATVYDKIFTGVRKYCPNLVICASTSGRSWSEFSNRSEVIELKPDMASLTLSSLNFLQQASVNSPDMISQLVEKMQQYGVVPELECFDFGMINYGLYLIKKEILQKPYYWNLIFGNIAGFQATASHIGLATQMIPQDHWVGLGGLGDNQLKVNALAVAMGYGVRVGIEDNIWWDASRTQFATNYSLVQRVHQLMALHGVTLLPGEEFRGMGFRNQQ